MHGSPPCAISVSRFATWRAAVGALAAVALGCLGAWLATSPLAEGAWVRAGVAVAAIAVLALAASLWRQPPVALRWSGLAWTMACPPDGPDLSGRLDIAIDLGSFLLLRFHADGRSGLLAQRWIPVGRAGLEPQWHAFRCALHSPDPAVRPPSAGLGQP